MMIEVISGFLLPRALWDSSCPLSQKYYGIALAHCAFSIMGHLWFLKLYEIFLPIVPETLWDTWVIDDNVWL